MSDPTPTTRRLRAFVYLRMSTDRQEDSPKVQREQTDPLCERAAYDVVDYYVDRAMKGDDDSRPEFRRLLRDAQAGKGDVVVCDRQDRLSRDEPEDFIADVVRPLKRAEVFLHTVKEGIQKWDNIGGLIVGTVQAHGASEEPKKISGRVLGALRKRVAEGKAAGGMAPFGYKWFYEQKEEKGRPVLKPVKLIPDREGGDRSPARVLQMLFDLYAGGGYSLQNLVDFLQERGVAPPKAKKKGKTCWSRTALRHVLKNDVYTGRVDVCRQSMSKWSELDGGEVRQKKHGGYKNLKTAAGKARKCMPATDNPEEVWVVSPVPHDALVSQELFDRVQQRLLKNRDGRTPAVRDGYSLSGMVVCEHCGSTLRGHPGRKGRRRLVYRCPGADEKDKREDREKVKRSPCLHAKVAQDVLLPKVIEVLEDFFLNPERLAALEAEIERQEEAERRPDNLAQLRADVADLTAKVERIKGNMALLEPDEIEAARARRKELEGRRDEVAARLEEATAGRSGVGELRERVGEIRANLWDLKEALRLADPVLLRAVLEGMVVRVSVRWDTRTPANGSTRRKLRPVVGGTIYVGDGWAEFLAVQSGSSLCTPGIAIPFTLDPAA
jgi:site-specific DNA recombinase